MHNADTQCTVEGREEAKGQRKFLHLYFSCLAIKYEFYFTPQIDKYLETNIHITLVTSSKFWVRFQHNEVEFYRTQDSKFPTCGKCGPELCLPFEGDASEVTHPSRKHLADRAPAEVPQIKAQHAAESCWRLGFTLLAPYMIHFPTVFSSYFLFTFMEVLIRRTEIPFF